MGIESSANAAEPAIFVLTKDQLDYAVNALIDEFLSCERGHLLKKAFLYGSYARGDFEEYSDVDLLFLADSRNPRELYECIRPLELRLTDEFGVEINAFFVDIDEFYQTMPVTSLYKNVVREGVTYYASEDMPHKDEKDILYRL